jgi:hypothetical protein
MLYSPITLYIHRNAFETECKLDVTNAIDGRQKWSLQQQTTIRSEFECEHSFLYQLPRDGCILRDILNYVKISPLEIIYC